MNIRKAVAVAPSNIAFIKYWGKFDSQLNIPLNNSISMNLSNAITKTSVEFSDNLHEDRIVFDDKSQLNPSSYTKVINHLDRIRDLAGIYLKAHVVTNNSFPIGIGIASSASGFAALTVAATTALGLDLPLKQMSSLARLGSGSACRSIPDGFVEWVAGKDHNSSYAIQIAPPNHWDIVVVSIIVEKSVKKLSSTEGQMLATLNPFMEVRQKMLKQRIELVRSAILTQDFELVGKETELDALSFHAIAMTTPFEKKNNWYSGAFYWSPETLEIIHAVQEWRTNGIKVYFTIDAGPTVHLLCLKQELTTVIDLIKELQKVKTKNSWEVITNYPALGARIITNQETIEKL